MTTQSATFYPASWWQATLALVPGLVLVAARGGSNQQIFSQSAFGAAGYGMLGLCLALTVTGVLYERRPAVWTFPACGLLVAGIFASTAGFLSSLAPNAAWVSWLVIFVLAAIVWIGILFFVLRQHLVHHVPRSTWLIASLFVFAHLASLILSLTGTHENPDFSELSAVTVVAIMSFGFWIYSFSLPVLVALPLAHRNGVSAGLVALAALFLFMDGIYDPSYAIAMWAQDSRIVWLVEVMPAVGFLLLAPLYVLRARSARSQALGLLLPPLIGLAIAEVISDSLRPYQTITFWVTRSLGLLEFLLVLVLAVLLYRSVRAKESSGVAVTSCS